MSLIENYLPNLIDFDREYDRLCELLTYEEILLDKKMYLSIEDKKREIESVVLKYRQYLKVQKDLQEVNDIISTETKEAELFLEEARNLKKKFQSVENDLIYELNNLNSIIESIVVEISSTRDGATELLNILATGYENFCKKFNFDFSVIDSKKDIFKVNILGNNVKGIFNEEKGVHCLKYDNKEECCKVFVYDCVSEIKDVNEDDIVINISRSSGAGGQHINTTDSAVKATHKPTGISASCQDERSQLQNKIKAIENLKKKIKLHYGSIEKKKVVTEKKKQLNEMLKNPYVKIYDKMHDKIVKSNFQELSLEEFLVGSVI